MEILHCSLFLLVTTVLLVQNAVNVDAARHHHLGKKQKNKNPPELSPAYAPTPGETPASPSPDNPPSIPSDPSYGPPQTRPVSNSSTSCIFDVTDFGAVGDGSNDDTDAFRTAWKAACQVENGVVLVPSGLSFVITSTIFSGPCQPGLVFQVRNDFFSLFFLLFTCHNSFISSKHY